MSGPGTIKALVGRAVHDSNGDATIEVAVELADGTVGEALAPRGSSTGQFEAPHLEDAAARPALAAAAPALDALRDRVVPALLGADAYDQRAVDTLLSGLDGGDGRSPIGGNTSVATSLAVLTAAAAARRTTPRDHLRELIGNRAVHPTATPMINIIDGSAAEGSAVHHHEFLVYPPPSAGLDVDRFIEHAVGLRARIESRWLARGVPVGSSKQGALSLRLSSVPEGLDEIMTAADELGMRPGEDFAIGLDMAAADVFADGRYAFAWLPEPVGPGELAAVYREWMGRYPIRYLEDPYTDDDPQSFAALTATASSVVIAGDDLYASQPGRVSEGVAGRWTSGCVLKPNQVGTVWAVVESAAIARDAGWTVLLSQRSGENGSGLISHIACAVGAVHVKCGGTSRMDRIAKIDALARLDAEPGWCP